MEIGSKVIIADAMGLEYERRVVQDYTFERGLIDVVTQDLIPACHAVESARHIAEINSRWVAAVKSAQEVQNGFRLPLQHTIYLASMVGAANVGFYTQMGVSSVYLKGDISVLETGDRHNLKLDFYATKATVNDEFLQLCELSDQHEENRYDWLNRASAAIYISKLWVKNKAKLAQTMHEHGIKGLRENSETIRELEFLIDPIFDGRHH